MDKDNVIKSDSDNLIYNRFDLIYKDNCELYEIEYMGKIYDVQVAFEDKIGKINVWGKNIPNVVMKELLLKIFANTEIYGIEVTRTINNFEDFLYQQNDFRVPLPKTTEELLTRVERRDRATIRRKKRWLSERVGTLNVEHYSNQIPQSIVEQYFEWKKISHGTDYNLVAEEYLKKYYVTDAIVVKANEELIGIAFYCACEKNVFFENFSYNTLYKEYSPGLLTYEFLLEHLIFQGYKYLYMAGGNYTYKRRFGSEETICYSGIIYREEFLSSFRKIVKDKNISDNVAIYGYGLYGHIYGRLLSKIGINIIYAIDRAAKSDEVLQVKSPKEELDEISDVIITIEKEITSVEKILSEKGKRFFYINDLLEEAGKTYNISLND